MTDDDADELERIGQRASDLPPMSYAERLRVRRFAGNAIAVPKHSTPEPIRDGECISTFFLRKDL